MKWKTIWMLKITGAEGKKLTSKGLPKISPKEYARSIGKMFTILIKKREYEHFQNQGLTYES